MASFPALLFMWAIILVAGQFIFYGEDLISETFNTIDLTNDEQDNTSLASSLLQFAFFPLNFVIGLVKLCLLTATNLPLVFKFVLGAPACVGLVWSLGLLIARILEGIGALIPFT